MILKFNVYADKLGRMIPVHMYLPDNYMESHKDYPVLYMLDGHNLFFDEDATYGRSWRLINYLNGFPDGIIVVGAECSHNGNDRLAEYAPASFYDPEFGGTFKGLGWKTMDFMVKNLKPYIDEHFPTMADREHTWIGGSSCGGTMALYGLYRYSHIYSKAVALSPYLTPSISELLKQAWQSRVRRPSSLYMSWGTREGWNAHEFVAETKACTDMSNILTRKGVRVYFNVKLYGEHTEASWEAEVPEFLRFLYD